MLSHRAVVTVLSKAALEPSIPVSVRWGKVLSASPDDALHHTVLVPFEDPVYGCLSGTSGCSRKGGDDALIFSSSSSILSCCRRSFAHLANSSWLLVAFRSRRTFM